MASTVLLLPDLSEFQPGADMAGIKASNGGAAIIRAAYGDADPDQVFARLRAAAAGYKFLGLYQYIVASQDVTAQAKAFVKLVGKLAAHEIPVIDLEEGDGNQSGRANAWLAAVDGAFGLTARPLGERSWLYSGESFATSHGLAGFFGSQRRTWLAAYNAVEPTMAHTLWQSTNGSVGAHITSWPGAGKCDTSLYHGTVSELAALITPATTPPVTAGAFPEDPMLLNLGAGAQTPIALPDGATAVRFFSQATATVMVDLRGGLPQETLSLGYSLAHQVAIPLGTHAIVVTRVDAGTNDVSFVSFVAAP